MKVHISNTSNVVENAGREYIPLSVVEFAALLDHLNGPDYQKLNAEIS